MFNIKQLSAVKKAHTGTPGSSSWQQGFDIKIVTEPKMEAYRVGIVWTQDEWRTTFHTEATLAKVENNKDHWEIDINYRTTSQITFYYALVAAGPNGKVWDNNNGWNYKI